MVIEVEKLVSELLEKIPQDHPDRKFLVGLSLIIESHLEKSSFEPFYNPEPSHGPNREVLHRIFLEKLNSRTPLPESFGARLRTYREVLGIKQKALAEQVGIHPDHFNRIEKERRKPPIAGTVIKLAKVLLLPDDHKQKLLELAGYSPKL